MIICILSVILTRLPFFPKHANFYQSLILFCESICLCVTYTWRNNSDPAAQHHPVSLAFLVQIFLWHIFKTTVFIVVSAIYTSTFIRSVYALATATLIVVFYMLLVSLKVNWLMLILCRFLRLVIVVLQILFLLWWSLDQCIWSEFSPPEPEKFNWRVSDKFLFQIRFLVWRA